MRKERGGGTEPENAGGLRQHRMNIYFSQREHQRLEKIRGETGASANNETIHQALRVYEWCLELKKRGARLQVVEGDATEQIIFLPFLP